MGNSRIFIDKSRYIFKEEIGFPPFLLFFLSSSFLLFHAVFYKYACLMFRKSKLHLSLQIRWKCRIRWKVGKHFQTRSWLVFIRFPLFSFRYSYCFVFYRINVGSSLMNPRFVRSRRFVGRSRNTLEQEADSCRFIFRESSYFTLYFRNVSIGCWKSQNDERKQAVSRIIKIYEKFTLYLKHLTLVNSFPKVRDDAMKRSFQL